MATNSLRQIFHRDFSKTLAVVLLGLNSSPLLSQYQLEPGVEWKSVTWPSNGVSGTAQTQQQSGQDWWYAHKNIYNGSGSHTGYATVGYTSLISTHTTGISTHTNLMATFNEGTLSIFNPIPPTTAHYNDDCEDWVEESPIRGVFGRIDLNGNMVFCKSITNGELLDLVQDPTSGNSDFFYVVGQHYGTMNFKQHTNYLPYNPTNTTTAINNTFAPSIGTSTANNGHMYIAKVNISNGNIVWEGLYGAVEYSTSPLNAYHTASPGYDIIYASNGHLIAVGGTGDPFIIELDPVNGYVLNKNVLWSSSVNSYSNSSTGGIGQALVEIGSSSKYAVGGLHYYQDTDDQYRAFLQEVDQNLSPFTSTWTTNPITFPGNYTINSTYNSNLWDLSYKNTVIYAGVLRECHPCTYGQVVNVGNAYVYRIANTGTIINSGTNPSPLGPPSSPGNVNAFDLRIGVTPTSDGGFIAVSTTSSGVSAANHVTPTTTELGFYGTCTFTTDPYANSFPAWDTDALVVKFDNGGSTEWSKTFDVGKNRPREQPFGDLRREECVYKITEADDGGFAISGNTSHNWDDYYIAKIYNPCNASQNYDVIATGTNVTSITGTNNPPWNSSKKVLGLVVVEPGAILTITGATTEIQFADSKRGMVPTGIIVMPGTTTGTLQIPGGRLNITNGAHLTSISNATCPGSMWDGIQVVGTSTANQQIHNTTGLATYQGLVSINGATISNAYNAITTIRTNENGNQWNTTGGIILADNAYFINNERDIQFLSYTNPQNSNENKSEFKRCHFLTNSILNNSVAPTGHVSMWDVRGVKFKGCEFAYNAGSAYTGDRHGYGIYSINSQYDINDYCTTSACTNFTQSSFSNLTHAVYANNSNPLRVVNIDHAVITNTYTNAAASIGAIILSSSNTSKITRCNINLSDPSDYGIYINNSKNYAINNNTITGYNAGYIEGIYAALSGGGEHKIYRNNLNNLNWGISPIGGNSAFSGNTGDPSDGLKMNCNTFSGNSRDIIMLGYNLPGLYASVAENQGILAPLSSPSATNLVRNRYNATCATGQYNQWGITTSTKTIQHVTNSDANTQPLFFNDCGSVLLNVVNSGTALVFTSHCPENETSPPTTTCAACARLADINSGLQNALDLRNILQDTYISSIDDGDTETLLSWVNSGTVTTIYADLLNISPYLSDLALIAYISRTATPVEKVIGVHNANRPVTSAVWNAIVDRGFDAREMDTLSAHQAIDPVSHRRALEDELGRSKAELQFVYAEKINYFLADTLETASDSVINLITANTGGIPDVKPLLLDAYINGGFYSRAFVYADSLKDNEEELEELMTLKLALLELDTAVNKIYKLQTDENLFEIINEFAEDSTKAGSWLARAVKKEVYGQDIRLLFPQIDEGGERLSSPSAHSKQDGTEPEKSILKPQSQLVIYPNPTNSSIRISCQGATPESLQFSVKDLLGKVLKSGDLKSGSEEIDFSDCSNGIYFVYLIENNRVLESKKLILQK